MKTLIEQSIANSLSYTDYRALITALLSEGKSTGTTENPDYFQYSELNNSRMNRLDKTLKILENHQEKLKNLSCNYTWLVISEGWCGDAAQILPVLTKMAEITDKIDLRIVLRDENLELMNKFLTNGNSAIPILLILDSENTLINFWGPRPSTASQMVIDYKSKHGVLDEDFKIRLQNWYNDDKGIEIQHEVMRLL